MKLAKNVRIYDYETYVENGYCIFDKVIREVGKMGDKGFEGIDAEEIDGKNKILLPGLINFHTHIYSTLVRGAAIPFNPSSFKDVLTQLWWKFDRQLNNEDTFNSAMVYGLESLKNGVTSLIDHHASGTDIIGSLAALRKAICDRLGMRGIFCFETGDRFDIDSCIKENMTGLSWKGQDAGGMFGLHASMSLSDKTLSEVSKFIGSHPIHVHVAESAEDEEDSFEKHGISAVERYEKHRLLNKDSLLAHCVHINEKEAKIIREKGAMVVLNPSSNMNNAVGAFNIDMFRSNGIGILIGTDGLGSNVAKEWTNLLYAGKAGIRNPNGISLNEIREYILKSYEYFERRLDLKVGKIQKDYAADLVMLDYRNPTDLNKNNVFGHLFYGLFDNFRPSHAWVRGHDAIKEYKSVFDEEEIYKSANSTSKNLWERIGVE